MPLVQIAADSFATANAAYAAGSLGTNWAPINSVQRGFLRVLTVGNLQGQFSALNTTGTQDITAARYAGTFTTPLTVDQVSTGTVRAGTFTVGPTERATVEIRGSGTELARTGYELHLFGISGNTTQLQTRILKRVAGATNQLYDAPLNWTAGQRFSLQGVGNVLTILRDLVPVASATVTDTVSPILQIGQPGIGCSANCGAGPWSAHNVTSTGGGVAVNGTVAANSTASFTFTAATPGTYQIVMTNTSPSGGTTTGTPITVVIT
jgi:hypothetical protein